MSILLNPKDFKEVRFGDVEWVAFRDYTLATANDIDDVIIFLGTFDKDVLEKISVGRVKNGSHKGKIIGFKDLPDYEFSKIDRHKIPFCELCRMFDTTKEVVCNSCSAEICRVCADFGECCDRYSDIRRYR